MKALLKKVIAEVMLDFVRKAFTWENFQLARNCIVEVIDSAVESTETKIDDWSWSAVKGLFNDTNLKTIYDFIVSQSEKWLGSESEKVYGIRYVDFKKLAEDIKPDGKVYAALSLTTILDILEIVIPYFIEWFKGVTNEKADN